MKKYIHSLVILLLFVFFPNRIFAESIPSFQTTISVASDSSMLSQEKIIYDFGTAERHGIYRDIKYTKTNADNEEYTLTIDSLSVRDTQGRSYAFQKTTDGTYIKLRIGDANRTVTGIHEYDITYRTQGAFVPYLDHDELYWNVTGNEWEVPIRSVRASIVFPFTPAKSDMKLACYTGIAGSTKSDCTITYDKGIVSAVVTKPIAAGEGLTVVIGFPKGLMTVTEAKKVNTDLQNGIETVLGVLVILASVFWFVVLPVWIIIKWIRTGRDPKGTIGAAHVWFDLPKTATGRDMTPGETGTLIDERVDMKDITATIVDLARRKYVKIIEKKKNDFYIEQINSTVKGDVLQPFEQTLLVNVFPGSKTNIRIKDTDLSGAVQKTKEKLYQAVVDDGFFLKDPQKTRTVYMVIAGVALFTGNIVLAIIAFFFGRSMPRKTVTGVNSAIIAKALKGFIGSQERQYAFQAKKQLYFEKFLPFAIVFGVEKIWADRFKDMDMTQPDWYQTYDNRIFNTVVFTRTFGHGFSTHFTASATVSRSSSGFSSGFSSGGGFSGGGGGGGGGGSW